MWALFDKVTPGLFEQNGRFVITGFEMNAEIKNFLLLFKELIPKNVATKNFIPAVSKLIRTVKVHLQNIFIDY